MVLNTLPTTQSPLSTGLPALGAAPAVFGQSKVNADDLGAGIGSSFSILTLRGKVWRTKYRGEEHVHMMAPAAPGLPPAGPRPSVEVVIVKASPVIAKIFYAEGYSEGDKEAPDCWSVNGQTPDPASPQKQCQTCAACPQNVWGSRMTAAGKAGKACQDSKRLAVVPAGDLRNELFGGPMLLRVPAASLQDMGAYSSLLQQHGHSYFSVVTSLSFDHTVAYPKLVFTPLRAVNDAEARTILELQDSPVTQRVLSEAVDYVKAEVPAALAGPSVVMAAAIGGAPTPAAQPDPSYQYTPDGKHRWKAGMAGWEPVPAPVVAASPPPPVVVAPPPPPPVPAQVIGQVSVPESHAGPAAAIAEMEAKLAAMKGQTTGTPPLPPEPATNTQTAAPVTPGTTRRRRGTATVTPPPSPAPTAPPAPPTMATPVVAAQEVLPPPMPTDPMAPTGGAIDQNLDDKLASLLG